jgi:hypothetical protein
LIVDDELIPYVLVAYSTKESVNSAPIVASPNVIPAFIEAVSMVYCVFVSVVVSVDVKANVYEVSILGPLATNVQ